MSENKEISFQKDGAPYSEKFDDIYFDTESGCSQSEQVFLKGNNIEQRLTTHYGIFTIAETGFGTGLNFLLTLKLFQTVFKQRSVENLHFITTEKYPLTKEQLAKSLACLPHLAEFSSQLLAVYPSKVRESTTLSFLDSQVKLTILIGDATQGLSSIESNKSGLIDAWYLDGFSPSKNPEMWTTELFEQMGRLSKEQATVATFTVAGIVRRGLLTNGFRTQRIAYSGKKKEILTGVFQNNSKQGKGYQSRPIRTKPQHVTIIGGGIASACAALALSNEGIKVTVYCRDKQLAQGASSNRIGALYPLIHQKRDDISEFYQRAFLFAQPFYQSLIEKGCEFSHQWCGLLELSFNEKLKIREQGIKTSTVWPTSLIHAVSAQKASKLANIPLSHSGLYIPNAGWIAPQELVHAIFSMAKKTNLVKIKTNTHISTATQSTDKKWVLTSNKGLFKASTLVLACGAESIDMFPLSDMPLQAVRGQVSVMPSIKQSEDLSTVICHKGYLTPAYKGAHCIGATFDKNRTDIDADEISDEYNLKMLANAMGETIPWSSEDILESKARLRCMTPDHMPIVGPMALVEDHKTLYSHLSKDKNWRYTTEAPFLDNIFVLSGLGARGLCSAPLLAEILMADICGTPYPVDSNMLFNLSTNRFIIRDIIKRKVAVS